LRSPDVYKYDLTVSGEGMFHVVEVERASLAKIPIKEKHEEEEM